jgi:hypothetical protein
LLQRCLADALALQVVPDKLVGVQLGRVARQKVQLKAPLETLDILRHGLGDVRRVAVEDEVHPAGPPPHEVGE